MCIRDRIRSVYELKRFLRRQLELLPEDMAKYYPKGIGVVCPVMTWSDDFSLAIAGVPSLVNEFGSGSFMETRYHSQYDNDGAYDPDIYYSVSYTHLDVYKRQKEGDGAAIPLFVLNERYVFPKGAAIGSCGKDSTSALPGPPYPPPWRTRRRKRPGPPDNTCLLYTSRCV